MPATPLTQTNPINPTDMDIRVLQLLQRGVKALETIATSLDSRTPTKTPSLDQLNERQLLCAEINAQLERLCIYEREGAEGLLANTFPDKKHLRQLTISELNEYAQFLKQLTITKLDKNAR